MLDERLFCAWPRWSFLVFHVELCRKLQQAYSIRSCYIYRIGLFDILKCHTSDKLNRTRFAPLFPCIPVLLRLIVNETTRCIECRNRIIFISRLSISCDIELDYRSVSITILIPGLNAALVTMSAVLRAFTSNIEIVTISFCVYRSRIELDYRLPIQH